MVRKIVKKKAAPRKKVGIKKPNNGIPKEGKYLGIHYDSYIEYYMICWMEELKQKGEIISYKRAKSYQLTTGFKNVYNFKLKNSVKEKSQIIMRPSLYTPEFEIIWNKKNNFVWLINSNTKFTKSLIGHLNQDNELYTIVECKPDIDRNNMTRLFTSNQKFMFTVHQVYTNLVKPNEFFEKTFCPKEYLKTPTGLERKLKFKPKLLN